VDTQALFEGDVQERKKEWIEEKKGGTSVQGHLEYGRQVRTLRSRLSLYGKSKIKMET